MQQRYYDPQIGRFLSSDPVPTDPNSGANFNRYSYANDNPYRFTDPDGRMSKEEADFKREQAQQRRAAHEQRQRIRNSDMFIQNNQTRMSYPSNQTGAKERAQHVRTVGPLAAIAAGESKKRAQKAESDSQLPGSFNGPADAQRHCTWSCDMSRSVGPVKAKQVGDVHEIWNVGLPDETQMDQYNNFQGRVLGGEPGTCPSLCEAAVQSGSLIVLPEDRWKK